MFHKGSRRLCPQASNTRKTKQRFDTASWGCVCVGQDSKGLPGFYRVLWCLSGLLASGLRVGCSNSLCRVFRKKRPGKYRQQALDVGSL